MVTLFNHARVKPKSRLVKSAQKTVDKLSDPEGQDISLKAYKAKLKKISHYIDTSRAYLLRVKSQCNQVIDSSFNDVTCLNAFAMQSLVDTRILDNKPSAFLQKAYTEQTFHANEEENINREQAYIDAGKKFDLYCEQHKTALTSKEKMLNDFGTVIAAINNVISQMNRTEYEINSISAESSNDDYQRIFMNVIQIPVFIKVLTEEVADKKTNVLNSKGGILANAYDDLLAMIEKFTAFYRDFSNRRYKSVSSEEKNTEMEMNEGSMEIKSTR